MSSLRRPGSARGRCSVNRRIATALLICKHDDVGRRVGVFVARTGAGTRVFRVPEMEAALARSFAPEAIKDITIPQDGLNSDIHASAEYRAHLVGVMARRAVAGCGQRRRPHR